MEILDKYPELADELERLCRKRCGETLQEMVIADDRYAQLRRARAEASSDILRMLPDGDLLDRYADASFAQERYELETLYRQGFADALRLASERGLL